MCVRMYLHIFVYVQAYVYTECAYAVVQNEN